MDESVLLCLLICVSIIADQTLSLHFFVGLICFCGFVFMIILESKVNTQNCHNFFFASKSPIILTSQKSNLFPELWYTAKCTVDTPMLTDLLIEEGA
jgi:hypothetical protein